MSSLLTHDRTKDLFLPVIAALSYAACLLTTELFPHQTISVVYVLNGTSTCKNIKGIPIIELLANITVRVYLSKICYLATKLGGYLVMSIHSQQLW